MNLPQVRTISLEGADNVAANAVVDTILKGFDKHFSVFVATSREALPHFINGDWQAENLAVQQRIDYYDRRVLETSEEIKALYKDQSFDDKTWQLIKLLYIGALVAHKQPELAETFFNSVCSKLLARSYFNNDYIFARPAISTDFIDAELPSFKSFYPAHLGMNVTIRTVLTYFDWFGAEFVDLDRDSTRIWRSARRYLGKTWRKFEFNCQIQVLCAPFFRNQTAYIIGRFINGYHEMPFVVPIRRNAHGQLFVDALILDSGQISLIFSLSRSYFLVDINVPANFVHFLGSILPHKTQAELYTMIGLGKQGKTMFYRDLIHHLKHSEDRFMIAPGIPGLVMLVFTLPSYPYVFKVLRDRFGHSKTVTPEQVKEKYYLVKHVDRVGRMADTHEFSYVALPRERFDPELLDALQRQCADKITFDDNEVVIAHLYIERRMEPLNLYLQRMIEQDDYANVEKSVYDYGMAIKELAMANIFPGDMLWKNFGITRFGRVVFYDYDEIEYMTSLNFRKVPPAPYPEMEMASEPWYSVHANDVFPEEFATFLLNIPSVRKAFLKHHRDLLDVKFWHEAQDAIKQSKVLDYRPYPVQAAFARQED